LSLPVLLAVVFRPGPPTFFFIFVVFAVRGAEKGAEDLDEESGHRSGESRFNGTPPRSPAAVRLDSLTAVNKRLRKT
jgi:hypothetical protein